MPNDDKNYDLDSFEADLLGGDINSEASSDVFRSQKEQEDVVVFQKSKILVAKKLLQNIKENNEQLIKLLSGTMSYEDEARISVSQSMDDGFKGASSSELEVENVIEGVFDGENMIGPDGKQYIISANYASKSKLVEGDVLKLTITDNGTFIYKQIGPIDRDRIVGELKKTEENEFLVSANGRTWRVLNASVTYFKGETGDEAVILVPKNGESKWAAVENVIKKQ